MKQGIGVAGFLPAGHREREIDLCLEKVKARMTVAHNGRVKRGELLDQPAVSYIVLGPSGGWQTGLILKEWQFLKESV